MNTVHSESVHPRGSRLLRTDHSRFERSRSHLSRSGLSNARLAAAVQLAQEPESPWAARAFGDLVPPATLAEARAHRDDLARLLRREREAATDFLLALADFDRRRGWERLGHASLFAFLTRELGLSNSAAWYRQAAARVLPRHPAVEAALRDGRLCLSVVGDLARVLTAQNEAEVLPRFLGTSSRDAKAVVAAILPCPTPPRRDAVTVARPAAREVAGAASGAGEALGAGRARGPSDSIGLGSASGPSDPIGAGRASEQRLTSPLGASTWLHAPTSGHAPDGGPSPCTTHSASLLAPEVAPTLPSRGVRDQVHPLTADLRRLSTTVSDRFLQKLATARAGLSHALPRATTEQVLEAALDLLLERQARRKALVKRPRASRAATPNSDQAHARAPTLGQDPATNPTTNPSPSTTPGSTTTSNLRRIPAAVERAVRLRDGDRCAFPLDAGGRCGSTWQVELDHVVPLAQGGATTATNLRCACRVHNGHSALEALGPAVMEDGRRRRRRRPMVQP